MNTSVAVNLYPLVSKLPVHQTDVGYSFYLVPLNRLGDEGESSQYITGAALDTLGHLLHLHVLPIGRTTVNYI